VVTKPPPGAGDAFLHLGLGVAGPVFACQGVVADDVLEGGAVAEQVGGQGVQLGEPPVPQDQPQVGIKYRDALVQLVQDHLHGGGIDGMFVLAHHSVRSV